MKYILNIFFLLVSNLLFAQNVDIKGHITNTTDNSNFGWVNIYLIKNEITIFGSVTDENGNFELKNIPTGLYDIKINTIGFKDKLIANFLINPDTKNLDIKYPNPCIPSKKICPFGHKKNLIPIIYGFPDKKLLKKAKEEKIKLGGCNITDCDPKWYCKTHKILF